MYAPVKITALTRSSVTSPWPTASSVVGTNCNTSLGIPASQSTWQSFQPTSTASGAGLIRTTLPAMTAANMPPHGMASGKFHGGVTSTTPNGSYVQSASSVTARSSDRA